MWRHANIKYVGFSMRSNLTYKDIFLGKYKMQQAQQHEWNEMVLRVPELCLPASEYGPGSASTRAMTMGDAKLKMNITALAESYKGSHQAAIALPVTGKNDSTNAIAGTNGTCPMHQITLSPTMFWYDNMHICATAHYRDFVFHEQYKMVSRGGFVEEQLSPNIVRTVERLGLREGHSRFGCYLLDDHSGLFFTGHLDGGSYVTSAQRQEVIAMHWDKKRQQQRSVD